MESQVDEMSKTCKALQSNKKVRLQNDDDSGVDEDEWPSGLVLDGDNHGLLAKERADCVVGRSDVDAADCAVIGSH